MTARPSLFEAVVLVDLEARKTLTFEVEELVMDPAVGATVIAVLGTLVGAVVGVLGTRSTETRKATEQRAAQSEATYREQLRLACSTHASNLTSYLWVAREEGRAYAAGNPGTADYVPSADLGKLRHAARVSMEQVRLLSNSSEVQQKGRMALKHAYAVMVEAAGQPDPRAGDYPQGPSPSRRFETAFREFLIESRRELGLANPEDVFAEP
jgi:hypothetical protein